MRKQTTYTSTLPHNLVKDLQNYSEKLNVSKKQLIEKAVINYLDELKRAEYAESFKKLKGDKEMILIAEEGMADYRLLLEKFENAEERKVVKKSRKQKR